MPLSDTQQLFLDNYVRKHPFKGKGKTQRAKGFAVVRDRAVQLLAKLPTIDPSYKPLKAALEAADAKADAGTFNQAAADMQQVVTDLGTAIAAFDPSKQFKSMDDHIDRAKRQADLAALSMGGLKAFLATKADALAAACVVDPQSAPVRGKLDAATWAAQMRAFIKTHRDHLQACETALKTNGDDLRKVQAIAVTLGGFAKSVDLDVKKIAPVCTAPANFDKLDRIRRRWRGEVLDNPAYAPLKDPADPTRFSRFDALTAPADAKETALQQAMRTLQLQVRIWEAQARQAETEARAKQTGLRPAAFEDLAKVQEEMTLGAASAKGPSTKPRRTDGLVEFDTAGFFASKDLAGPGSAPGGAKPDVAALKKGAAAELLKFVKAQKATPDSPEMFDLSLRSMTELGNEYAAGQGWDLAKLTDDQKAAAKAVGEGMFEAVRSLTPDKLVLKGNATLHLNGKAYGNPELLGEGGMGRAMRYTDPTDGSTVVVKTLKKLSDVKRAEMVKEIKAQRHLMTGDDKAVGRNNVVGLKGAVTDEDGNVHMVMEVVDGGDLEDNRMGMMVAARGNALPEEARNVLQQAATKQAVEGLIYLRGQNVVHFDVKGANIFLDGDGNAKVADYGSATVGTSPTGQQVMDRNTGTTPGYVAPEGGGGVTVDERFDTHALGKVIQVMHANALGAAVYDPARLTGSLQRLSEAMSAKNPDDRPTLEAVLESSYLKNLDAYDPELVKTLGTKSVAYTKALRAEMKTVGSTVPADIMKEAQKVNDAKRPEDVTFADLTRLCASEIDKKTLAAAKAVKALEAGGLTPQQQAEKKKEIADARAAVKAHQDILDRFGQSDAAKKLAAEMKEISQRLTRPQADIRGDVGDLRGLATALFDSAGDPAGFYSVVTSPAWRPAFEEVGVDYPALLKLAGHYQMNLTADNPNADAEVKALEQQVPAFVAGLPKDGGILSGALADGLEAVVADLKMRRKDPMAERRLRELLKAVSMAVNAPPAFHKVLGHPELASAFALIEADQKHLATLASAHEMDLGSGNPKARQHFAAWQRLVAKALGGLPSKGPAKDVTEMIGRGFETLTDKLEQKLERDQV